MRRLLIGGSLARRLLVLQLVVVAVTVAIGATVTVVTARDRAREQERQRVLAVAETFAQSPAVVEATRAQDRDRVLQPLAERVRRRTGVDFVVAMSPQGIRYSHPNPARIGQRFVGDIEPAVHGRSFTETFEGTLGPSVRAVVPVRAGRRIVGLVSVGVLQERIATALSHQLPGLLALAAAALLAGTVLSLLLARRVRRQTLGLDPEEIVVLYEHHDATLHAIREGVLVLGRDGRVSLANDEARRLLALGEDVIGHTLEEALPDGSLRALLAGGRAARDELHVGAGRVLVVTQSTARVGGRAVGTVITLRDRTELESLGRELDTVRTFADSLRAQAHESANQLHTMVGMVELGRYEEAVAFATEQVEVTQELLVRLQERIDEPALVALLLGKTALARERGIVLDVSDDTAFRGAGLPASELVTIVGNLIDNAMDAIASSGAAGWIEACLRIDDGEALIEVRDSGPGIAPQDAERVFEPGWSTKAAGAHGQRGLGLALVRQAVLRLGGTVTAASEDGAVLTARLPLKARVEAT